MEYEHEALRRYMLESSGPKSVVPDEMLKRCQASADLTEISTPKNTSR